MPKICKKRRRKMWRKECAKIFSKCRYPKKAAKVVLQGPLKEIRPKNTYRRKVSEFRAQNKK